VLPIECYFCHEQITTDISSTMVGGVTLYMYKQVLIAYALPDKAQLYAVALPLTGQMYMRGIEIPYPLCAGEIDARHIKECLRAAKYPGDKLKYLPHAQLCEGAMMAIMRDMYQFNTDKKAAA